MILHYWPRRSGGGKPGVAHRAAIWLHALAVVFCSVGTAPSSRGHILFSARDDKSQTRFIDNPGANHVPSADGTSPFTDPEAATSPSRVYRFRVQ